MKKTILFFILLLAGGLNAQSLATSNVGSAGQELKATSGTIHFNVGEVAISDHGSIREGVIQVFDISTLVNNQFDRSSVNIFPNPSSGEFTIQQSTDFFKSWIVTDNQGRGIQRITLNSNQELVLLSDLPSGQYYLIAQDNEKTISAFPLQIIK